jgi:phosphatidylserine synthase 2
MPPRTLPLKESPSINDMEEYVYRDAINASIRFLYRPHTISVLSILLSGFVYLAFYGSAGHSPYYNALQGLAVAAVVFIFYGMTQLRDGPFIRPHPVFWRAVQAVSVIYLTSLVFLFFQVEHINSYPFNDGLEC